MVQRQQGGHPSKNVWDAAADTTWGDAIFTRARAEPATPAGQDVAPSSPTCAVTWATSPTRARPSAWRRVHCLLQEKRAEGDGERGGPRSWREDGRGHCRLNVCPTRTKGGLKNRVVTGGSRPTWLWPPTRAGCERRRRGKQVERRRTQGRARVHPTPAPASTPRGCHTTPAPPAPQAHCPTRARTSTCTRSNKKSNGSTQNRRDQATKLQNIYLRTRWYRYSPSARGRC